MASHAPISASGREGAEASSEQSMRRAQVQALLARLVANSPIYSFALLAMELETVSRGSVTTRLRLTERHANSKGGLHGAVSATVVDFVTGLAIASWDGRATTGASVDMHLSYLATARAGDWVRVEARAERVGGSLAFVTVSIVRVGEGGAADEVVVLAQHTKYVRGTAPAVTTG
ncbi:thioesterase superfamily protein [Hirsutella rhossiliensis]|uniref:Thioesterase superfamily domain-containing protein n=1 Tax=Hirsutella rhossiliensis TaxID=111463 RepID=A0A9P8SMF1_9HYPO|nr:thioesterase superfamily domain-containing protein [Hirsutella rhossiliensis]KAH0966066.1 thioesterase superfamily domain-containing protein [Hirsutella rhossiliensis]